MSSSTRRIPPAPKDLPAPHRRVQRAAGARARIDVSLKVVTPIFGGAPVPRTVDKIEVIRAASVRGHLRFWWRALNAHRFTDPQELYQHETQLWGGPTGVDTGRRSPVELRVDVTKKAGIDSEPPPMSSCEGYALFPARADTKGTPTAERRHPDTELDLVLEFPSEHEEAVHAALRAWLLFGGYGGRTRRGLGSLTVAEKQRKEWLPATGAVDALERLFGPAKLFSPPTNPPHYTPTLAGAKLVTAAKPVDAPEAWTIALSWLRDFRQGTEGEIRAREPSGDRKRPSISNWPEADKVRQFSTPDRGLPWAHEPRHNDRAAWPRAALGLPIIGRFQDYARQRAGEPRKRWTECNPAKTEPGLFEIGWQEGNEYHDRLASPLIVKPLALASGRFVPMALWLSRAYPPGEAVLRDAPASAAPFTRLVAPGDTAHFAALAGHDDIREAFFAWLKPRLTATTIAAYSKDGKKRR